MNSEQFITVGEKKLIKITTNLYKTKTVSSRITYFRTTGYFHVKLNVI